MIHNSSCTPLLLLTVILIWHLPIISSYPTAMNPPFQTTVLGLNDEMKSSNNSGCPNNCNSQGQCSHGNCVCYAFFSGDACQERWRSDKSWYGFWTFYYILVIIMHVVGMAWCAWNLYCIKEKLQKNHYSKWPISAYLVMMFFVASFGMC